MMTAKVLSLVVFRYFSNPTHLIVKDDHSKTTLYDACF